MDAIYSVLPRPPEAVGSGLKKDGVRKSARKGQARRSADGSEEYSEEDLPTFAETKKQLLEEESVSLDIVDVAHNNNGGSQKKKEALTQNKDPNPKYVEPQKPSQESKRSQGQGEGQANSSAPSHLATEYGPGVKSCPTGLSPTVKHFDAEV